MELKFTELNEKNYESLHQLMLAYYREGEDAETSEDELDSFIGMLFNAVMTKEIDGRLVKVDGKIAGFVLYALDKEDGMFSEIPEHGTILEIGISTAFRGRGLGKAVVDFAEAELKKCGAKGMYVCAYGSAERFWEKCGYQKSDKIADNGLPIFMKM